MSQPDPAYSSEHRSINPGFASFLIIIAELMATSLWFSINGVADNLMGAWETNLAGIG